RVQVTCRVRPRTSAGQWEARPSSQSTTPLVPARRPFPEVEPERLGLAMPPSYRPRRSVGGADGQFNHRRVGKGRDQTEGWDSLG
ncbi:MAG: hypothetical protein WBF51_00045, partial [Candidatus Dormiibacterota bacterium]